MASLSPSTINNLTIPLNPQIISNNNLRLRSKKSIISCKKHNNNNESPNKTPILDRRNMLIGLGGLYGSTLPLTTESPANAEPMAPDVYSCTLTDAQWDNSVGDHCCPPKFPDKIKEFSFDDYPRPVELKKRRPAHVVSKDPEYVHDYNRAISIMRTGLTPFDPRNFYQQAKIHCAYCDASYPQFNNPDKRLEVHGSWLFASFHRWYLFFFERIMGKLINKPEFALPFWNWDHPDGMQIPEMFKDVDSSLYDANRNIDHLSRIISLNYDSKLPDIGDNQIPEWRIQQNLDVMHRQMVHPAYPSLFFGEQYRLGDDIDRRCGPGYLEVSPHNNVHDWMGSATVRSHQDMGAFWSAARDPIFYCHHANVDRMWHLWRTVLPGRSRVDIRDSDYLNAWFVFYDENANPVKVKVRDSFDIEKLGYTYDQDVELPWLHRPPPRRPSPRTTKTPFTTESVTFPKALNSVIKTQFRRPSKSLRRTMLEKEEEEEILVIDFELCFVDDEFVKFDVYINDPIDHSNDDEKTRVTPEMAGTYTALPHRGMQHNKMMNGKDEMKRKCTLKLALNALLKEIGVDDVDVIEVALVPRSGTKCLDITAVKIDFISE
ncbi:polyphenol oxidase, chloroplastic-like [Silene latifolia]|uniref:polyphenol oxidase, chloroplastic-like n=1 Tax=Silene latifolia TaxID=37657 RepID=UPI003D787247